MTLNLVLHLSLTLLQAVGNCRGFEVTNREFSRITSNSTLTPNGANNVETHWFSNRLFCAQRCKGMGANVCNGFEWSIVPNENRQFQCKTYQYILQDMLTYVKDQLSLVPWQNIFFYVFIQSSRHT